MKRLLTPIFLLLGLGASVATLLSYFGAAHWLFDLLAHFRVQYAVGLLISLLVVGWGDFGRFDTLRTGRKRLILTLFTLALLANAVAIAPYVVPKTTAQTPPDLRVMTLNVHAKNSDFASIADAIEQSSADIVLVVEVIPELAARLEQLAAYPYSISAPRSGYFGMVMLSKQPWVDSEILGGAGQVALGGREELPSVSAMIEVEGQPVKIIGMHAYPPFNGSSTAFRNGQMAYVAQLAQDSAEPFILLGDLNATPWSAPMRQIFAETDLVDSAESFGIQSSWMSRMPLFGIPIDHVLVSAEFTTLNHTVGPDVGSDHFPITVDLGLP